MSDTMLLAVLNMPPDLWDGGELDIVQRYGRYRQAVERIHELKDALNSTQYSLHCMEQAGAFENNGLDQKMVKGIVKTIADVLGR